jgi:hypothetical protein
VKVKLLCSEACRSSEGVCEPCDIRRRVRISFLSATLKKATLLGGLVWILGYSLYEDTRFLRLTSKLVDLRKEYANPAMFVAGQ